MAAPLRVLAMNSLAPPFGGAEAHFEGLVALLREHGVQVLVHHPAPTTGVVALRDRVLNPAVRRFTEESLRDFRPDVIHVHNFLRRLSVAPFLAARGTGVATVLTAHDFQLFCPRTWAIRADGSACREASFLRCALGACRGGEEGLAGRAVYAMNTVRQRWAASVVGRRATRIVAPCRSLADRLTESLGREVGVLPLLPSPAPSSEFEPPRSKDLLYVGRIAPEKGLVEFLGSLDRSVRMTVAGDGPSLERAKSAAAARGLGGVTFLGRVPPERVRSLLRGHGALVVPSLVLETGPLVAMEAFAEGRPVIGSDRGGTADLVADGDTGLLFDALDPASAAAAVARFVAMPAAEHEAMSRRARTRAERTADRGAAFALVEAEYRAAMAAAGARA